MIKDNGINYLKLEFWINLFFQKGTLIIAEVAGIILLIKALGSTPFDSLLAASGAALIGLSVVVEYLIWTKKSPSLLRRIKALEEKGKKTDGYIIKLSREVMNPPSKESEEKSKKKKK
ncbi:MAG: hypothetical protein JRJ39_01390 [Deltaproteobacteria bacterium]|nr:hypothetical protein [Deltaproteobacteria bacterium]